MRSRRKRNYPENADSAPSRVLSKMPFAPRTGWMCLLFLAGILIGSLCMKYFGAQFQAVLENLVKNTFENQKNSNFLQLFQFSFVSAFSYIVIVFLCGFSAIAVPVCFIVPFVKGLGVGAILGYLYANLGLSGIGLTAISLLPNIVLTSIVLISAAGVSCDFSLVIFKNLFLTGEQYKLKNYAKHYCFKFIVYTVFSVFCALLDALLAIFIRLF